MKDDLPHKDVHAEKSLTPEKLKTLKTIRIKVTAEFSEVIAELNKRLGANLKSRPEGFHVTIVDPTESRILANLSQEQLSALEELSSYAKEGQIKVLGIGVIDGQTRSDLREVDRVKKTAYVSIDGEKINELRQKLGLLPRFPHITLGFEGGDIHMKVVGTNEKGKPILEFIPKNAELEFQDIKLPPIIFGGLSGQEKEQKK